MHVLHQQDSEWKMYPRHVVSGIFERNVSPLKVFLGIKKCNTAQCQCGLVRKFQEHVSHRGTSLIRKRPLP